MDAVLAREIRPALPRRQAAADVGHRGRREPGHAVALAGADPTLIDRVMEVLGRGAKPEMAGPAAPPVVAGVADHEAGRDRADRELVRQPVRRDLTPLVREAAVARSVVDRAGPLPAIANHVDSDPEGCGAVGIGRAADGRAGHAMGPSSG